MIGSRLLFEAYGKGRTTRPPRIVGCHRSMYFLIAALYSLIGTMSSVVTML